MRKLRNKHGERLILDVSGRKAIMKSEKETIHYTAFIEFDRTAEYEKIRKIRLVNCFSN